VSGTITREYTVWCGSCSAWVQRAMLRDKAHMAKVARRLGWTLTKLRGWLCPECASRRKSDPCALGHE